MTWLHTIWTNFQAGQFPELGVWGYLLLALLVAVEGPIATLLGAAAASAGAMRPAFVFMAAATGNLTADTLWYTLGYAGKINWILHLGSRLGIRRRHLDRLEQGMHRHAAKILLVAKLTSGLVIPSLIAAGLARVPWRRWFPAILSAEMIWTGSLVLIGYFATEAIKKVERGVEFFGLAITTLFLLAIFWGVRRLLRKQENVVEIVEEGQNKDIKEE